MFGRAWALDVSVRAELDPALRDLHGGLTYTLAEGEPEPAWIDPLARLPSPADDRMRLRTFPGPENEGSVRWTRVGNTLTFETHLPERNGDVGWTRRHGLRANGGWLPTPVDPAGRPILVNWDARIASGATTRRPAASDVVLVLNDAIVRPRLDPTTPVLPGASRPGGVAEGLQPSAPRIVPPPRADVRWSGRADRLSLAAFVERSGDSALFGTSYGGNHSSTVQIAGKGARRHRDALEAAYGAVVLGAPRAQGSVNVLLGPDDGRLAHVGPGIVYLSERAFRVWPRGLRRWHAPTVRAAIVAAACTACQDGAARALYGRLGAGESHLASRRGIRPHGLGTIIDMNMQDPAIPVWADMYDRPWLRAPDLYEALAGTIPAEALALQLAALEGPRFGTNAGASAAAEATPVTGRVATLLAEGVPLRDALAAVGVSPTIRDGWLGTTVTAPASGESVRKGEDGPQAPAHGSVGAGSPLSPSPPAELAVDATDDGAVVTRSAPPGTPQEVIPVVVDGRAGAWVTGSSNDGKVEVLVLPGTTRVEVDPGGATRDVERGNNRLPRRWSTRPSGGLYALNLSERTFDAGIFLVLRHRGDTRHTWYVAAAHDAQDLASLQVGHGFGFGRLVRPRARSWRADVLGGATLLDPTFDAPGRLPTGAVSLDAKVILTRDTLEDAFFPLEGTHLTLDAQGGYITVQESTWTRIGTTAVGILAPHPRHALAARLRAGAAFGDVANRLLPLGGANDVRGLGESAWLCNERASASLEYRYRVLGNGALPLGPGWLTELHLSPGLDLGMGRRERATAAVIGVSGGVHGTVDLFGLIPASGGISVGWPLAARGTPVGGAQLYLDAQHPF